MSCKFPLNPNPMSTVTGPRPWQYGQISDQLHALTALCSRMSLYCTGGWVGHRVGHPDMLWKENYAPCHEDVWREWRYSSITRHRWVVSFTQQPIKANGKSPQYPLTGGWASPRASLDNEKSLASAGNRNSSSQPIAHRQSELSLC
jgi:hypothetical protein